MFNYVVLKCKNLNVWKNLLLFYHQGHKTVLVWSRNPSFCPICKIIDMDKYIFCIIMWGRGACPLSACPSIGHTMLVSPTSSCIISEKKNMEMLNDVGNMRSLILPEPTEAPCRVRPLYGFCLYSDPFHCHCQRLCHLTKEICHHSQAFFIRNGV
jgi:hypothetical protein